MSILYRFMSRKKNPRSSDTAGRAGNEKPAVSDLTAGTYTVEVSDVQAPDDESQTYFLAAAEEG